MGSWRGVGRGDRDEGGRGGLEGWWFMFRVLLKGNLEQAIKARYKR